MCMYIFIKKETCFCSDFSPHEEPREAIGVSRKNDAICTLSNLALYIEFHFKYFFLRFYIFI